MNQLPPGSSREKVRDALHKKPFQTVPDLVESTGLTAEQIRSAISYMVPCFIVEKDGCREVTYPSGRPVQLPLYRLVPGAMPTRMDDPTLGIELQSIWKPLGRP